MSFLFLEAVLKFNDINLDYSFNAINDADPSPSSHVMIYVFTVPSAMVAVTRAALPAGFAESDEMPFPLRSVP